jgi:hypothetical protein
VLKEACRFTAQLPLVALAPAYGGREGHEGTRLIELCGEGEQEQSPPRARSHTSVCGLSESAISDDADAASVRLVDSGGKATFEGGCDVAHSQDRRAWVHEV